VDDVTSDVGYIVAPGPFGAVTLGKYLVDSVSTGRKLYKLFKDLSPEEKFILEDLPWE
jgi:hypothetical protein